MFDSHKKSPINTKLPFPLYLLTINARSKKYNRFQVQIKSDQPLFATMAQVSIILKAFLLAFFVAAAAVSAQEMAPAPAPVSAATSLPVSGGMIGASVLLSAVVALLRH